MPNLIAFDISGIEGDTKRRHLSPAIAVPVGPRDPVPEMSFSGSFPSVSAAAPESTRGRLRRLNGNGKNADSIHDGVHCEVASEAVGDLVLSSLENQLAEEARRHKYNESRKDRSDAQCANGDLESNTLPIFSIDPNREVAMFHSNSQLGNGQVFDENIAEVSPIPRMHAEFSRLPYYSGEYTRINSDNLLSVIFELVDRPGGLCKSRSFWCGGAFRERSPGRPSKFSGSRFFWSGRSLIERSNLYDDLGGRSKPAARPVASALGSPPAEMSVCDGCMCNIGKRCMFWNPD